LPKRWTQEEREKDLVNADRNIKYLKSQLNFWEKVKQLNEEKLKK